MIEGIKAAGLNTVQINALRLKHGLNALPSAKKASVIKIFLNQFTSPLVVVLLFVVLISVIFKEYTDAVLVFVVIFLNSILGFYQEFKAQKTLDALRLLVQPKSKVVRDGHRQEISAEELLPGDLVILGYGERIPADGEIFSGNLVVNEAVLSGESEAVEKDEKDKVFMGTIILSGEGQMIVTKIGVQTEFGQIGKSLMEIEKEETPLQKKLEELSRQLAYLVLATCLFIFIFGLLTQERSFLEMLRISIILAAAAIPEGLPMATTIIMAIGMKRILDKKGLVKRLLSIETLGSTSVICTDKTGTLTEGKMRVVKTDFEEKEKAIETMILNNNQRTNLEIALWEYAKTKEGRNPQEFFSQIKRLKHHSFDSTKKYSSTVIEMNGKKFSLMMGAPDIITHFCSMKEEKRRSIHQQMEGYADEGLRLLGFCYREGDEEKLDNYKWSGLIAIEDPIRQDVVESFQKAINSGIQVKIVSGDFLKTAVAVAKKIGLKVEKENALEGKEIEKMSVSELAAVISKIIVFARVSPQQKLKIIEALKQNGEVVAMTGDGVNDAPALKKADIGIAMSDGTDVAKETADLILLDNSFSVIEAAIEEGRTVFANTKKVIAYVLSNSFADIIVIFLAMLFDLPMPLLILQILWIHIICDGPPDLMLGFEPKEEGIWDQKPQSINSERILDRKVKVLVGTISILTGVFAFFLFWYFWKKTNNLSLAQTMVFALLSMISLVYIYNFKNLNKRAWHSKMFNNKYLNLGVLYGLILVVVAIYLPPLANLLKLSQIGLSHWIYVLSFCFFLVLVIEVIQFLFMKKSKEVV